MMNACRAECEDRLRAEFRIEMNAAVAESEQRWQSQEQELQTQISELQSQLTEVSRLYKLNDTNPSKLPGLSTLRHDVSSLYSI